ncbi:hypothetical protein Cgig2_005400 [Carnegiea gigantea]|uniref:CCHC-type domain-containing protein n=1 Tax=Carnegiea gigantea TaxID=171969 RepID=A0A9Q1JTR9_9CARY|nr:hypothetical protein Cgig2_005400 [Carnegiea gigantea]
MAEGLEEAWKRLSLTEEEEAIVVCDDSVPDGQVEQVALCLWGKLLTDNYFNAGAMKNIFKNMWKPAKGIIIRDLAKNLFAFEFFSAADKAYCFEQPSEIKFMTTRFWVKAMEVPPMKQTSSFAKILGNNLREFVDCDESNLFCAADKSVNFQVDIDITKPLRWGMQVMIKLLEFCYNCRRLGHVLNGCELLDDSLDKSNLQYGDWLWGSPIKPSQHNIEAEKQEAKRLFMGFGNGKKFGKAQTKLIFGASSHPTPDNSSAVQEATPPHTESMMVDDSQLVTMGTKAFKRKLVDKGKRAETEQKVRLVDTLPTPATDLSSTAEVSMQPSQGP